MRLYVLYRYVPSDGGVADWLDGDKYMLEDAPLQAI